MGNDVLENKVDTNKSNTIEEKELLTFIGNQKNLEELGTYINAMPSKDRGDSLYRTTQEQIEKYMPSIANKVRSDQQLTVDEKNIMKLQYFLDRSACPKSDDILNGYLGVKFGNQFYLTKSSFVKEKSPVMTNQKENSKSNWNDGLQIISCREGFEKGAVDRLMLWIKEYDGVGYEKARISAETRHVNKESAYIKDYVEYDLVNYALQKYSDIINKKDKELQRQAGYSDDADFLNQMGKIGEIGKAVEAYKKEKFPNIDATINQFMSYSSDISDSAEKQGYNTPQDQEKATENYKEFIKEVSKIAKDQNTQELMQKLQNQEISSGEQLQEYFLMINKVFAYTTTYQTLKNKYGSNAIDTYEKYMKSVKDITQKYGQENIINWSVEIENYSNSLQRFKQGFDPDINRDTYKKYDAMVQKEGLTPYKQSLFRLSNVVSNPTDANSPFFGLQLQAQEKKQNQSNVDGIWNTIKNINPIAYQSLNFGASAWNGLVDFIVGAGSSLGLMLQRSWKTDDERSASADFKEQFDSFLKFNVSTEQSKPPLDEDGNFDLGIDNTVSQVGGQLANMVALLSGAGGIGKGITKLGVNAVLSQRVGLVSMAFIQNIGRSFQEGIGQGLDNGQAVGYAIFQSTISSGLELVSPNDMIMGTGKSVAKNYIKNLFTSETKESFVQVGKLFGKNIGKEIVEENMQEALQLAVGNGINLRANDKWNAKFDANFSIDNFAATALLTTLTTGLASSKQALKQAEYDMGPLSLVQKDQIKQEIIKNPSLYQNITQIIHQIKSNAMSIEGVDIESILQLEGELKMYETKNKNSVENTDAEEDMENKIDVEGKENEGKRKEKEEIHSEVVKNTYDEIIKEITIDVEKGNNVEKNTYMLASMKNLAKTSRTAQGILDASASENKKFKFEDISPEQGGIQALENFRKVSEYLYENKSKQFTSPKELQEFIENIAKDVNAGILKPEYFIRDENPSLDANGKPKYAYTEVNDLNIAFKDFCNSFLEKLNNPNIDPIELAAWVEYRVNIKDHFFADGCGKISIALSNFVLMRYGKELPDIRSKDERFEFTGKTQRNAKDPNNEPDLENRTNYYKTLFTMKEINKLSDIKAIEEYIKNPDNNKNLPTGKEIIIGAKDKKYIIVTREGNLGIKTIENYVMDKINDIKDMQEVDKFIEKYNRTNPSKSKEMVLGRKDGYCIIRNDKNGEIKRININESNLEKPVDFTKMSSQEILEYAIQNTDLIIQKYQKSQKIGEEFVVDVDGFRKFLGADEKVDAQLTHEGASYLADYYIDWIIKNNKELIGKNITIRFIGGGAGSGKSLVSKFSPNEIYNGAWDGTMKTYNNAKMKIDHAIENGYNVQIDFVFRNMNDAWNNGVLKRTIEQNLGTRIANIQDIIDGKYDDVLGKINYVGRTLPLSAFKAGHLGARATFAKLYVEGYHKNMTFYSGDGKIDFNDFIDLHKNDIFNDDIAKQNVELIFKKGFISEQQYFELLGINKK